MALKFSPGKAAKTPFPATSPRRRRRFMIATGLAAAAALAAGLIVPAVAEAATPSLSYGTLDTQPGNGAVEARDGIANAMFELNWASFEPTQGTLSQSYLNTMQYYLRSFQAAGQKITLGLGLQNPPSWVYNLPDATYVDQNGNNSTEANFVYSQAVRTAATKFLTLVNASLPFSDFSVIRITSGGDGEMLYPGGGTYWAFDHAALTGDGLAAGMTPNPDPMWRPGNPGMSQAQIAAWVSWYIGGLDNVTKWQIQTLNYLGFSGTYETVTPGSGTRPDYLAQTEQQWLPNDGTTGVGAVWNLYYAQLWNRNRIMAYISSVADQSGGNDSCQPSDTTLPLTSATMDSWSATRWITRIADQYKMPVGGENPGYGLPPSIDTFYVNTSPTGMMAAALRQARSCNFTLFYWAHDVHLWDGTIPFSVYVSSISQ
jgi:hypothetical protein